jgi:hypothetical protein
MKIAIPAPALVLLSTFAADGSKAFGAKGSKAGGYTNAVNTKGASR